ncbi:MAG: acyltransferase family protein [Bacilli bacterium]|nr:acyltransferase family protein [Bacilli bacterium]
MKCSKKYYKDLDLIRVVLCIGILLYHLNILKGGYLAVCSFFVLSGYLSCKSLFRKEKISLKDYYLNRILKIYLPLLLVVFISISVISFIPSINWFNLKPETTSVLFGYNNFWQLSANLDYFARHVNSPFIHLWYIAILLQFDLIFPFIFIGLKKLGEKINKHVPVLVISILTILFTLIFYKFSLEDNIMVTYYSSYTRVFSLLFGVTLGFLHNYYGKLIPKFIKNDKLNKLIFYLYLLITIVLFIFIDSKSILFPYAMIVVTVISCRLIDYGILDNKKKLSFFDKCIKRLSNISYEIYLVQYPLIFLLQNTNINWYLKIIIIILSTILLSLVLNFSIKLKENKFKVLRYILSSIILIISLYGCFRYIITEDHTKEMKQLEQQLAQNQEMIQNKQEEYKKQLQEEENNYLESLTNLENIEKDLKDVVTNMTVVGVGDSVMLGAVENLYTQFPNGYFDAQISRTAWVAHGILNDLKNNNMLGDPIVINLGANGDCSLDCKKEIVDLCEDREIFWLTVTNDRDVNVNGELKELSNIYNNVHIIDWDIISKGHNEYFIADGIHLTPKGREVYTKTIYDSIYNHYLEKYTKQKEQLINEYEEKQKNKITFLGNDILLNVFENIQSDYKDDKFIIDKNFNYELIKSKILEETNNNIVFAFDSLSYLNSNDYINLINMCENKHIYILVMDKQILEALQEYKNENVIIIDFYNEIIEHSDYLMADRIHLSDEGNKALSQLLKESINKK